MAEEYQLSLDDIVIGAGTGFELVGGPAGFGLPEVRSSDTARPLDHGLFFGADFLGGRKLGLELALLADTPEAAAGMMDQLARRWQPPEGAEGVKALEMRLPGLESRVLYGRPRRLAFDTDLIRAGMVRAVLEFEAADPRLYAATETSTTTGLPIVAGGRTYPRTYALTFGAQGATGTILAVNAGTYPTRPVATILGPVVDPRLENITTGETLVLDYTLPAGRTLEVDFDARTVLEGGTSSRYYALVAGSSWWELVPGVNEIKYRATVYEADARLTLRWRSAWL